MKMKFEYQNKKYKIKAKTFDVVDKRIRFFLEDSSIETYPLNQIFILECTGMGNSSQVFDYALLHSKYMEDFRNWLSNHVDIDQIIELDSEHNIHEKYFFMRFHLKNSDGSTVYSIDNDPGYQEALKSFKEADPEEIAEGNEPYRIEFIANGNFKGTDITLYTESYHQ